MSEELGTAPLTAPGVDPEKLLDYMKRLDGVGFVVISREGLPVYIEGSIDKEEAEAIAALGEEALKRLESSFGKIGGGRVTKLSVDVAQGRLYVSRLDGGTIIYRAVPRLADVLVEVVERLREGRPVKCQNCGYDLTLATYKCPRCGKTIPFIARECPHCGALVDIKRCPSCGATIRSDGTLAKPPKAPVYLGYAASAAMFAVGGLAMAIHHGAAPAGIASVIAGAVIAISTFLLSRRL